MIFVKQNEVEKFIKDNKIIEFFNHAYKNISKTLSENPNYNFMYDFESDLLHFEGDTHTISLFSEDVAYPYKDFYIQFIIYYDEIKTHKFLWTYYFVSRKTIPNLTIEKKLSIMFTFSIFILSLAIGISIIFFSSYVTLFASPLGLVFVYIAFRILFERYNTKSYNNNIFFKKFNVEGKNKQQINSFLRNKLCDNFVEYSEYDSDFERLSCVNNSLFLNCKYEYDNIQSQKIKLEADSYELSNQLEKIIKNFMNITNIFQLDSNIPKHKVIPQKNLNK